MSRTERSAFLAGVFFITLVTLAFELLNTRLLSVLSWYHLSFFAVSTAMFGMSAGAVRVYLGGSAFEGAAARRQIARHATAFAFSIPGCHFISLLIPIRVGSDIVAIASIVASTLTIALPFYFSGITVAIALTRIPGPTGLVYAVDLVGAALGSLLMLPLLEALDISSAALVLAAIACIGAGCLTRFAELPGAASRLAVALLLMVVAGLNATTLGGMRVIFVKGQATRPWTLEGEFWSMHGMVRVHSAEDRVPKYWGPGLGADQYEVNAAELAIDGAAGTAITRWDGKRESLAWVQHDVTALPYHLRKGGRAVVIGVGGGRDVLTALWSGSTSVTGIELNGVFVDLLRGPYRDYAGIADRPEVRLVHDEARSYLTRTRDEYDVMQMSLVDTWAATGAGAFTLSENGLYTVEAWREFLGRLSPGGIFSVSRWYSPSTASETSRLLALATASLLDRGVTLPSQHLILATRGRAATLMVSNEPFGRADREAVVAVAHRFGFDILVAPGLVIEDPLIGRIVSSGSAEALKAAVSGQPFDTTPPTDQRPYFFNILRPGDFLTGRIPDEGAGVLAAGNLLATRTLAILWIVSLALVVLVILLPLARSGLPDMPRRDFALAVWYFAAIGLGFMLVQIPLIQRFSVYLGHPTYAVAVILFSMILATGIGSYVSDFLPVERDQRWLLAIPLCVTTLLGVGVLTLQPVIDASIGRSLLERCSIVVGIVGVTALPLGCCFPVGLRLIRRISNEVAPWMWGVNGACGVLAGVSAVWTSLWLGIDANLWLALVLYASLVIPAAALWRRGAPGHTSGE